MEKRWEFLGKESERSLAKREKDSWLYPSHLLLPFILLMDWGDGGGLDLNHIWSNLTQEMNEKAAKFAQKKKRKEENLVQQTRLPLRSNMRLWFSTKKLNFKAKIQEQRHFLKLTIQKKVFFLELATGGAFFRVFGKSRVPQCPLGPKMKESPFYCFFLFQTGFP